MRAERGRKKKLIVAFHFQFANQAAWKCDACRRQGLEEKRRCGWINIEGPARVIWARRGHGVTQCPTSYITGQSLAWLEEYCTWKLLGRADIRSLPARQVEAFWVLENELMEESQHERQ